VERQTRELERLRKEQKRYAAAVAKAPDVPELLSEMSRRQERIRSPEEAIATAAVAPRAAREELGNLINEISATFGRLRKGLIGAPDEARQALRALFPGGLYFAAVDNHWTVTGAPRFKLKEESPAYGASPAFATPAGFEPAFMP
jgi:hypothetical protein